MSYLDAVADPIRLRIARCLAERGPLSVPELAGATAVHANTVRAHLAELTDAGIVATDSERRGRGRPRIRYALTSDWTPTDEGFRGLAELLCAALIRGGADRQKLHALGAEWGRYLLGRPGDADFRHELPRALEALGFQARVARNRLHLSGCPCPLVSPEKPELVCGLADSVIEGVLSGTDSGLKLADAQHHPARRSCHATLRRAA
jgi:predicted ArsR family transcriptional regulator